jgi:hypothetical protein
MSVELSPEEQIKVDAYLKELGVEKGLDVVKKLNDEAKTYRERTEKAEAETKALRDAETARKADDDKRKADEQKSKDDAEKAKQTMDQRLEAMEKKLASAIENGDKAAKKAAEDARAELTDKIAKRDARLAMQALRAAAKDRGIIDQDLVDMLDVSKIKVDDGEVDVEAVNALIEEHAKAKPHLYPENADRTRDENGRFTRPDPALKAGKGLDWAKLSDKEFEEKRDALRSGRL